MRVFEPSRLRLYVWASLVSQILIVVTGGVVRLTGSGLGCPTWPKCTDESLVTVPEMGIHGVIEFVNRVLTFVLVAIALLTFITVKRLAKAERTGLVWTSFALGMGIVAQAVVGGISVLVKLNPWVVGLHFVVSAVLISIASILVWNFYRPVHQPLPYAPVVLAWPITILGALAVLIGIVVTGAGPHAGDSATPRNGLDLEIWQHFHSYPAYLLLLLTSISFANLVRTENSAHRRLTTRITALLLAAEIVQAIIGVVQARLGVPPVLVATHMLGASILCSLLTFYFLTTMSFSNSFSK